MINNQLFGWPMALISLVAAVVMARVTSIRAAEEAVEDRRRRALVAGLLRARSIWSRCRVNRRRAPAA